MRTILRIGTTDYDHTATGRAAAGIFGLRYQSDLDAGRSLSFSVKRCGADAPFVPGVEARLTTTDDDGSNPVLRFVGDLDDPQLAGSDTGYVWSYACTDLVHRANRVTITGVDGTGSANFNLTPDDPLALYALSGQTVGAIIRAILEAPSNANPLDDFGLGNYTTLTPPTLPAATLADLALLTVVPPSPVQLRGESLFNAIQGLASYWHPRFAMWLEADGTIRCGDVFGFPTVTLTCPTDTDNGDPIDWPTYSGPNCRDCFTAVQIHGLDIQRAVLSLVDGTAIGAWDPDDEAGGSIKDFLMPRDGYDEGDLSGVTATSATVSSDFADHFWATNFWNDSDRQGWVQFFDSAGTGIDLHEERQITSCTALAAGGSATITWDASLPLASTTYDRYKIVGNASPRARVWREFYVRDPSTEAVGLDTFVGSRLYPRFPKGSWLANLSSTQQIFYPTAVVRWSSDGSYPWFEVPIRCQINPKKGTILLAEPAPLKFGDPAALQEGWPTAFADGLPYDILFYVPYNRGALSARYPASGNEGEAYTKYGIPWVRHFHLDSYTWNGDTASLVTLAQEHHAVLCNPVIEGSVLHHGIPEGFDPFGMEQSLEVVTPGQATQLDGVPLPVRTRVIDWPDDGELHTVTFQFSTQRRPFQGDELHLPHSLSGQSFGTQGELWSPAFGSMDMGEYNAMAADMGQMQAPASNQLSAAMANNPLANQPNALSDAMQSNQLSDSMQDNPLQQAMGNNQLGDAMANFGKGGEEFAGMGFDGGMGMPMGPVESNKHKAERTKKREAAAGRRADFLGEPRAWGPPGRDVPGTGTPKPKAPAKAAKKPITKAERAEKLKARKNSEDAFRAEQSGQPMPWGPPSKSPQSPKPKSGPMPWGPPGKELPNWSDDEEGGN